MFESLKRKDKMIEKRSPFYAFRYLVTPTSEQISIIHGLNKSKEELMTDIVRYLAIKTKTEWTKGNKRFLFYGFQSQENIYIICMFVYNLGYTQTRYKYYQASDIYSSQFFKYLRTMLYF